MRKRNVIILIGILFTVFMSQSLTGFALTDKVVVSKEFEKLKIALEVEIHRPPLNDSSNTNDYWKTNTGRTIISMGKKVLPLLMEEIKTGHFWYNPAVEEITGIKMTGQYEQEKSKEWVLWWQDKENDPQWNVFISPSRQVEGNLK